MDNAEKTPAQNETDQAAQKLTQLKQAVQQVIFGQDTLIDLVITALLARGHILLEGLPGLGKTELVKSFSKALGMSTNRVQFTPDLLPGDITGNPMLQEKDGQRQFVFQQGPVFTNLLLADEINRASPKTQSALLEAMQESRVTVMGESHPLPKPFFVFATQNPIELEGTYPLPEAQLDRFLFKLTVTRTNVNTLEKIISKRNLGEEPETQLTCSEAELIQYTELTRQVYLPEAVSQYIARLVNGTHPGESEAASALKFGASPRAAIGLAAAVKGKAILAGRVHASCEDVTEIAPHVLRHRIVLSYQARMESKDAESVVQSLLEEITPESKQLPKSLTAAKIQ